MSCRLRVNVGEFSPALGVVGSFRDPALLLELNESLNDNALNEDKLLSVEPSSDIDDLLELPFMPLKLCLILNITDPFAYGEGCTRPIQQRVRSHADISTQTTLAERTRRGGSKRAALGHEHEIYNLLESAPCSPYSCLPLQSSPAWI
jgi:hypothetical protein